MTTAYVGFDVETDRLFGLHERPGSRPTGIRVVSIAVLYVSPQHTRVASYSTHPPLPTASSGSGGGGGLLTVLTAAEVRTVIDALWAHFTHACTTLVTWGGTIADWALLAAGARDAAYAKRCVTMALGSVDLPFTLLCHRGYMVGLAAAASGAGLADKPIASTDAATAWTPDTADRVVALCLGDATNTVHLAHLIRCHGILQWRRRDGTTAVWRVPRHQVSGQLLTAWESMTVLALPLQRWRNEDVTPATSCAWMGLPASTMAALAAFDAVPLFGKAPPPRAAASAAAAAAAAAPAAPAATPPAATPPPATPPPAQAPAGRSAPAAEAGTA